MTWRHELYIYTSTEVLFKRENAGKWTGKDSRRKRVKERESGGLELDEGHISFHWVGNSEKKPLVIEKQRNQRRKNSCRAMGAEKQACLPHLFFFFSFFPPTVVSHSATEETCIVASRLVRPLSTRILEGIGGDTAQMGLYAAVWRILLSAESCFCRKEKQWRNMQNQNLYRSSTVYVRKEFESGFQ